MGHSSEKPNTTVDSIKQCDMLLLQDAATPNAPARRSTRGGGRGRGGGGGGGSEVKTTTKTAQRSLFQEDDQPPQVSYKSNQIQIKIIRCCQK